MIFWGLFVILAEIFQRPAPMSKPPDRILYELRRHCPVKNSVVRRNLQIRWTTTIVLAFMAPVGMYVGMTGTQTLFPITGWVAGVVAGAGMLGIASGWLSRRRHGFDAQWGFAPLAPKEIQELSAIANADPDLGDIVDLWAGRCLEMGCNLRGRDLMLLRKKARLYLKAKGETLPSLSPRV